MCNFSVFPKGIDCMSFGPQGGVSGSIKRISWVIWYASRLWDNFGQLLISNHSRILHITLQPCPCHWPLTRPAHLCQALSNGRAAAAESNERRKIGAPQGPFDRIQSTYTRGNSMIYYQRSTVIAHFRYKWSMGARTFGMVSSAKKTTSKSVSWTLKKDSKQGRMLLFMAPITLPHKLPFLTKGV